MSLSRQSERFARAPCTHVRMVNAVIFEAVRMSLRPSLSRVAEQTLRWKAQSNRPLQVVSFSPTLP